MAELSPLDLVCLFAFAGKMSFLFGKKTGWLFVEYFADVVKLVDTPDLGSGAERCESSSLSVRTIYYNTINYTTRYLLLDIYRLNLRVINRTYINRQKEDYHAGV